MLVEKAVADRKGWDYTYRKVCPGCSDLEHVHQVAQTVVSRQKPVAPLSEEAGPTYTAPYSPDLVKGPGHMLQVQDTAVPRPRLSEGDRTKAKEMTVHGKSGVTSLVGLHEVQRQEKPGQGRVADEAVVSLPRAGQGEQTWAPEVERRRRECPRRDSRLSSRLRFAKGQAVVAGRS